jgi:hypothetical protein
VNQGYGVQAISVAGQPALRSLVHAPASATMFPSGRYSDGANAVIWRIPVTLGQRFSEAGIGTHEPRYFAHTSRDKVSMAVSDSLKLAWHGAIARAQQAGI